jgi:hypothetical protein
MGTMETMNASPRGVMRVARMGRSVLSLVMVGMVMVLVLGTLWAEVAAQASPTSYQNGFTAACRNHGGAPQRVRSRVVKCTLQDGTVITCDFNVDPPSCATAAARPSSPVKGTIVSPVASNARLVNDIIQAGGATWSGHLGANASVMMRAAAHGRLSHQGHGHSKGHRR